MNGIDVSFPHLGISIPSLPKGITIGTFTIAYYGIIIALGMVGGVLLARWQAKRTNQCQIDTHCQIGNKNILHQIPMLPAHGL